jgi:hypothetical protein
MSDNRDLQDERISKLYKLGEQSEPPKHLDAEIKKAARATSPVKKSTLWPSLATAAVLVLSFSLILKVLEQKPLEESMMDSATQDDSPSPNIMLQESDEKMLGRGDSNIPKLQRNRAVKQKTTPVPAKQKTAGATQFEAAPAMVEEMDSHQTEALECSNITLPETDLKEEWIQQYQAAMQSGKVELARCLKDAYRARFKTAIPEPTK